MNRLSENTELLHQTLTSFSCKQDTDIEFFLHNRAVEFETLSKSCTYLIVDEEGLLNGTFMILDYFSLFDKTFISGTSILHMAYNIIATAVSLIGGRYMMIECHKEPKLIKFYKDNLFHEITYIPNDNIPMIQMIRKI